MNNPQRCVHGLIIGPIACSRCDPAAYERCEPAAYERAVQAQRSVVGVPNPPARPAGQHSKASMPDCRDDQLRRTEPCLKRQYAGGMRLWRQDCPRCGAVVREGGTDGACGMEQPTAIVSAPHSAMFWLGADG